ncbi:MAG: hypothetical protein RSB59_06390 [Clostridia bacterium]
MPSEFGIFSGRRDSEASGKPCKIKCFPVQFRQSRCMQAERVPWQAPESKNHHKYGGFFIFHTIFKLRVAEK